MAKPLAVISEARRCTVCADALPEGPKPLLAGRTTSLILIIGQAPGLATHNSGTPWKDRSGDRLRDWLGLSHEQFYDDGLVALMPMGFCYPGKKGSGDAPPRPECAPLWHKKIMSKLRGVALTVFVGRYAYEHYLAEDCPTLTDAVRSHAKLLPRRIALPHPSPRNNIWLKKHAWFALQTLPALRQQVQAIIS